MTHVVAKAFCSVNRRFRVGDPVSENADPRELEPHTFESLTEGRWLVRDETKAGKQAAKAGDVIGAAETERAIMAAQDSLRQQWEAAQGGSTPIVPWAIHISDEELYGEVQQEQGNVIYVQVPGEEAMRFYPTESIDYGTRSVSGKYKDSPTAVPPPRRR